MCKEKKNGCIFLLLLIISSYLKFSLSLSLSLFSLSVSGHPTTISPLDLVLVRDFLLLRLFDSLLLLFVLLIALHILLLLNHFPPFAQLEFPSPAKHRRAKRAGVALADLPGLGVAPFSLLGLAGLPGLAMGLFSFLELPGPVLLAPEGARDEAERVDVVFWSRRDRALALPGGAEGAAAGGALDAAVDDAQRALFEGGLAGLVVAEALL